MARFLILLLALVLPVLVYWLYDRMMRRRDAFMGTEPWYVRAPWAKLLAVGVGLVAVLLFLSVFLNPAPQSGQYIPPHLQDGKVIPGQVLPESKP